MPDKTLDAKLQRIRESPGCRDFILADAKDADMAYGLAAPGQSPEHHAAEANFRTLDQYRELIRRNVRQGLVDIMLMSASTSDVLTIRERLFDDSRITPAIRANDTSDIWLAAGGIYASRPSRPFRTATIDHAMCGRVRCEPHERGIGTDLGLYSVTFNNDLDHDLRILERYNDFRVEAEAKGFRHFLEVFNPNAPQAEIADIPRYLNDMIARLLAGVTGAARPLFLKIPYHGPAAMEALAGYDRSLVVGILGGAPGTTFDAFHQLWEAKKYGARVALYSRMINQAEDQPTFIRRLRAVADDQIEPKEAVRSYHAALTDMGIQPDRSLEDDLQSTKRDSAYAAGAASVAVDGLAGRAGSGPSHGVGEPRDDEQPDFARMTSGQKVQWNLRRWRRVLG